MFAVGFEKKKRKKNIAARIQLFGSAFETFYRNVFDS